MIDEHSAAGNQEPCDTLSDPESDIVENAVDNRSCRNEHGVYQGIFLFLFYLKYYQCRKTFFLIPFTDELMIDWIDFLKSMYVKI